MSNKPLISIIIPVYNKARYIKKCLNSLLNQSFTNFEIVIVNDGSTDNSGMLLETYAAEDSRIVYIATENSGVSSARNVALEKAYGEYVTFVDADDYVEFGYLQDIVKHIGEERADLYMWGIMKETAKGICTPFNPTMRGEYDRMQFLKLSVKNQYIECPGICGFVSNKLLKREVITKYKLKFDPQVPLSEDLDFFLSFYNVMHKVVVFENTGYHYIQDAENSSATRNNVDYLQLIDIQFKYQKIVSDNAALTSESKYVFRNYINGLALASLLEMHTVSYQKVKELMKELAKRGIMYHDIAVLRPSLKAFLGKNILLTIYLKMWQKYLQLRRQ